MERNALKISQTASGELEYYFKNEHGEWVQLSYESPLSTYEYTHTTIKEKGKDILALIDSVYNCGKRGVDIFVSGDDRGEKILAKILENDYSQEQYTCTSTNIRKTLIVGKSGSGKTTLLSALKTMSGNDNQFTFEESAGLQISCLTDTSCEGRMDELIKQYHPSGLIYCFSNNRIENVEAKMLKYVHSKYSDVNVLAVITQCTEDNPADMLNKVKEILNGIPVLPVLAKDIIIRNGVSIPAYGVDTIYKAVIGAQ